MLWRRDLQYSTLCPRPGLLVAVPQTDRFESSAYQWQILLHSGRASRVRGCSVAIVLIAVPLCSRLALSGPHRLATVDEPGWRALSASLDAAATVPRRDENRDAAAVCMTYVYLLYRTS